MSAIRIRRMKPSDLAFIIDTWVETWRNSYAAGVIPMPHYQADARKHVAWLLEVRAPEVLVVYDAEAEVPGTELLGFLAYEKTATYPTGRSASGRSSSRTVGPVVHYVAVKEFQRGHGLARALFQAAGIEQHGKWVFTFKPTKLEKTKIPRARWNPLIARHAPTKTTTPDGADDR